MSFARTSQALLTMLLAGASAAYAQPSTKVRIDDVRVGFKVRGDVDAFKGGTWTPIYVDLTAGAERIDNGEADLVLETSDADDMQNTYSVRLPALDPKEQRTVITYARPGYHGTDISVSVVRTKDKDNRVYAHYKQQSRYDAMPPYGVLYLCAGSPLSGFKRALAAERPKPKTNAPGDPGAPLEDVEIDTGSLRVASVSSVQQLPTRWFGYSAIDVLFLTSGSEGFIKELLEDQQNHKEAMAEWVRRGGRIVISAGRNYQFVAQLLAKMALIDCAITGSVQRRLLAGVGEWGGRALEPRGLDGGVTDIEVAKLEPGLGVETLLTERKAGEKPMPLVVQAPSGLGRVMIVGFDLDVQPFAGWSGQTEFWRRLHKEIDPPDAMHRVAKDTDTRNSGGFGGDTNELATKLYNSLESFPAVPVVKFSWVALFILLYILVVGPLDYYFLKKVVKRLELTWITFPAVVIVVSTVAYFTAYYLKGNDMLINKVDVVDIDLRSPQVYGSTWFTIFSPRIQHYTIGVEPAAGVWTTPSGKENDYSSNVGWFGRLENNVNSFSRGGSAGLFRRAYDYAPDATGLTGVPIQVWSLKAFTASWQAPLPAGKDALFSAQLEASPDGRRVSGTITSNLPSDLVEAVVLFGGKSYSLKPLKAGEMQRLDPMGPDSGARQAQTWFSEDFALMRRLPADNQYNPRKLEDVNSFMKSLLFHGEDGSGANKLNSSLRHLDQGWRLRSRSLNEVIICGRLTPQEGAAEKVGQDGASASRLWLGKLPKGEGTPPALSGTLSQDTYVRIYIPVKR